MNVTGQSKLNEATNILPLFGAIEDIIPDPLQELLDEGRIEALPEESRPYVARDVVTPEHFPDQSLYILDRQLESLKLTLGRLKFYLSDLDDLILTKIN